MKALALLAFEVAVRICFPEEMLSQLNARVSSVGTFTHILVVQSLRTHLQVVGMLRFVFLT